MTAKSKSRQPRSRKPDPSSDIEERIRQRSFEWYASSAERLTDSLWTTGSKRKPRFSERRSNGRSKPREDQSRCQPTRSRADRERHGV